jgi:hypothetical protein
MRRLDASEIGPVDCCQPDLPDVAVNTAFWQFLTGIGRRLLP